MNIRTALALGTCLSLASFSAVAHQVSVEGDVEASGDGYIAVGGSVLKTGLGGCMQTGNLSDDNLINACAGIEDDAAAEADATADAADAVEAETKAVEAVEPAPVRKIDTRQFSELALFDTGSASLTAAGRSMIDGLLGQLAEYKGITDMSIVGHTDSVGSEEFNQALSEQRAATVAAALSETFPDVRMDVSGMGESSPVATNDTAEGRQMNRRVEVEVTATRMTFE